MTLREATQFSYFKKSNKFGSTLRETANQSRYNPMKFFASETKRQMKANADDDQLDEMTFYQSTRPPND